MDYTQITYEVVDRIARLSMNRPRVKNAQSRVLLEELDDAFTRAKDDRDVRVVVLRGEGDSFSAGHDLGSPERTPKSVFDRSRRDHNLCRCRRWRKEKSARLVRSHVTCEEA